MPINFSRKFWPNFSRGEKDRALSAAMTMPSMVFSLGPCIRTVNSEVVGSAPASTVRGGKATSEKQTSGRGVHRKTSWKGQDRCARFLPSHFLIVPKYNIQNIMFAF